MAQAGVAPVPVASPAIPVPSPAATPPPTVSPLSPSASTSTNIAGDGVTDVAELARLLSLIRQTEAQENTVARSIVIGEFSVLAARVPHSFIPALQALSRNEAAVMRFLGWGRSNPDIGMLMNCNETTVRSHMNNAIRKLQVDGMRELNSIAGLLFHPLD